MQMGVHSVIYDNSRAMNELAIVIIINQQLLYAIKLMDMQVEKQTDRQIDSQSGTRRQHTSLASHRAVTKLTLVCLWCIGYHYKNNKNANFFRKF